MTELGLKPELACACDRCTTQPLPLLVSICLGDGQLRLRIKKGIVTCCSGAAVREEKAWSLGSREVSTFRGCCMDSGNNGGKPTRSETPYCRDLPLQPILSLLEAKVRDEAGPWGRDPTCGLMLT